MDFQAVIFTLGREEYGIPIEAVREITQLAEVYPVPQAPEYIQGLIKIRGQAIPLLSLQKKFGIESEKNCEFALIVEINGNSIGMAVEEVKEVRNLENVSPPPPLIKVPFISGIVNFADRIILKISPERMLEDEELTELNALVE